MIPATSPKKCQRPNLKHGLHTLKRAVAVLGSRALPTKRTALGRELRAWRDSLVADLGGPEAVSTQQLALVEKVVTQRLICDSLDAYTLSLGSLVNKRHRAVWPIVRERAAQVALLQSLLRDLGLERRHHEVDIAAQLAAMHRPGGAQPAGDTPEPPPTPADGGNAAQARDAGNVGETTPDPARTDGGPEQKIEE